MVAGRGDEVRERTLPWVEDISRDVEKETDGEILEALAFLSFSLP